MYADIVRDYFKANPYVAIVHDDGRVEKQIIKGYQPPTDRMVEDVITIARTWLSKLIDNIPDDPGDDGDNQTEYGFGKSGPLI